jgi:hypothetical protein
VWNSLGADDSACSAHIYVDSGLSGFNSYATAASASASQQNVEAVSGRRIKINKGNQIDHLGTLKEELAEEYRRQR